MRLIDADALMAQFGILDDYDEVFVGNLRAEIDNAPTIELRPRGRWINHRKDRGHHIADCDQCGGTLQWLEPDERPNFCQDCGADMREEGRDELHSSKGQAN